MKSFSNVYQWNEDDFKEKISKLFSKEEHTVLELGCGKGEYTVSLAKKYPNTHFVGIDIQGERIWSGAKYALENNLNNVHFLRIQIENLSEYIPKGSIDEIWLTFPDPFLKDRDSKKRLTSHRFLEMYKYILRKNGIIHLKTDSKELYEYTLDSIKEMGFDLVEGIEDIYGNGNMDNISDIQTSFEKRFVDEGRKIMYLKINI